MAERPDAERRKLENTEMTGRAKPKVFTILMGLIVLAVGAFATTGGISSLQAKTETVTRCACPDDDPDTCRDFGPTCYSYTTGGPDWMLLLSGLFFLIIGILVVWAGLKGHSISKAGPGDWRDRWGYEPHAGMDPDRGGGV
jgi:hypothetical protein